MSCRVRTPGQGRHKATRLTVKLKATIGVAALLAATAAHAETIDLKCWARGLTGSERNSVYIIGEQVTVNLDEGTMHSRTFGSNLAVHVTDTHLFFETALTLGNIWLHLFDPTAVWQGFINPSTARLRRINATVLSSAGTASWSAEPAHVADGSKAEEFTLSTIGPLRSPKRTSVQPLMSTRSVASSGFAGLNSPQTVTVALPRMGNLS